MCVFVCVCVFVCMCVYLCVCMQALASPVYGGQQALSCWQLLRGKHSVPRGKAHRLRERIVKSARTCVYLCVVVCCCCCCCCCCVCVCVYLCVVVCACMCGPVYARVYTQASLAGPTTRKVEGLILCGKYLH